MPKSSNGHLPRGSVASILATDDIKEHEVDVPEWGCSVLIRTFTRKQVAEMTRRATSKDRYTGKDNLDTKMLEALSFVEGVADPKFTLEDYERLEEKSIGAMMRIVKAINLHSGLSEEAVQGEIKSDSERPDDALRVVPSKGAAHDEIPVA